MCLVGLNTVNKVEYSNGVQASISRKVVTWLAARGHFDLKAPRVALMLICTALKNSCQKNSAWETVAKSMVADWWPSGPSPIHGGAESICCSC